MYASASAISHHGEIIQGVFRDEMDRLHRGLVTLPFAPRHTIALARKMPERGIEIEPTCKTKSLEAIRLFLHDRGYSEKGFKITLRSNIPDGFGLGSSTADIIASIRATARLLQLPAKPRDILKLAVRAESASDGTMFLKRPRLVCQREGEVLERFKQHLPPFSLISINVAPDNPVDTLKHPPARYDDNEIEEFAVLRRLLRSALKNRDIRLLGQVSTRSAIINQKHLPQPHFSDLLEIVRKAGLPGLQVAHSGRMIGIMLPPEARYADRKVQEIQQDLLSLGLFPEYHSIPHPFHA